MCNVVFKSKNVTAYCSTEVTELSNHDSVHGIRCFEALLRRGVLYRNALPLWVKDERKLQLKLADLE